LVEVQAQSHDASQQDDGGTGQGAHESGHAQSPWKPKATALMDVIESIDDCRHAAIRQVRRALCEPAIQYLIHV
jgi:hypothetical protein